MASVLVLASGLLMPGLGQADDGDLRRTLVGVKLFAAFLAADEDVESKKGSDGRLHLLILHSGDTATASAVAERLQGIDSVRNLPLAVKLTDTGHLATLPTAEPPAALFIAEWLPDLRPVMRFAAVHHALVFSPLLGDVERGVHGGLHVSDRILPVVNTAALARDNIYIKSFFLEVARRYEE